MSLNGQFQFRRDTAANWTANDPTLLDGEVGLETDTRNLKFGDGVTAWSSLGYAAVGTTSTSEDNETVAGSGTAWTLAHTPSAGCVPVVKQVIAGFGMVELVKDAITAEGFSVAGSAITTVSSFASGALRCSYRY